MLSSDQQSPDQLACRLALMAWEQGHQVGILTADDQAAKALDDLMWQYPGGRFLPHSRKDVDPSVPVRIGTRLDHIKGAADLLINMTLVEISEPEQFSRILEIVPAIETERVASREKFRAYRKLGLSPVSHEMSAKK